MITNKLDLIGEYEAQLDSPATPKKRREFLEERVKILRREVKLEIIKEKNIFSFYGENNEQKESF